MTPNARNALIVVCCVHVHVRVHVHAWHEVELSSLPRVGLVRVGVRACGHVPWSSPTPQPTQTFGGGPGLW